MTNVNINGGTIGGLQVGDNNTQPITQNNNTPHAVSVDRVFQAVEEAIADSPDAEAIKTEVIEPLKELAKEPPEKQGPTVMERAKELTGRLEPYAPAIAKCLKAIGTSGLQLLAASNPIAGVLLAGVNAIDVTTA